MVEILRNEGNFVALKLSGKLRDADYQHFVPVIQAAAEKGKLHLLIQMENFPGWDSQALWDDVRLDVKFGGNIERLAFIGDKAWESWMARLRKPFTGARIEYLAADDARDAWAWVQDGL